MTFIINWCFEIEKDDIFKTETIEVEDTIINEEGVPETIKRS